MYDTWHFVPFADFSALFTYCPMLISDRSVTNTLCSVLGPSGKPYSIVTNEDVQVHLATRNEDNYALR